MEAIIKKNYTFLARVSLAIALVTMTILGLVPTEQIPLSDWNDKAQHIIAFLILAFLIDASYPETELNWKKTLALFGYGLMLEGLQGFTDYRQLSGLDLLANAAGIGLYAVTSPLLKKIPVINWRWNQSCTPD